MQKIKITGGIHNNAGITPNTIRRIDKPLLPRQSAIPGIVIRGNVSCGNNLVNVFRVNHDRGFIGRILRADDNILELGENLNLECNQTKTKKCYVFHDHLNLMQR